MKLASIIALFIVTETSEAKIICRHDFKCRSNWFKKYCCSDFECNTWCNTKRCRTNSCGVEKCAKKARDFYDYYEKGKHCTFETVRMDMEFEEEGFFM